MNIQPQDCYVIVDAPPDFRRTDEFVINDQAGNVLQYLERRENMIVLTEEEFDNLRRDMEPAITCAFLAGQSQTVGLEDYLKKAL